MATQQQRRRSEDLTERDGAEASGRNLSQSHCLVQHCPFVEISMLGLHCPHHLRRQEREGGLSCPPRDPLAIFSLVRTGSLARSAPSRR